MKAIGGPAPFHCVARAGCVLPVCGRRDGAGGTQPFAGVTDIESQSRRDHYQHPVQILGRSVKMGSDRCRRCENHRMKSKATAYIEMAREVSAELDQALSFHGLYFGPMTRSDTR